MSNILLWTDNASTLLASGITNVQTTCTVQAGQGALFPNPAAGQVFVGTFEDTSGNIEIFQCTARTGDVFTIVRAQEGTTALAFSSGSRVEIRCTAGMLQAMLQKNGGDALNGTTTLAGVLQLNSGGSIQGGEFTGFLRSGPGVTAGQISVNSGNGYVGVVSVANQMMTPGNIGTIIAPATSGLDVCRTNMIVFWNGLIGAVPTGWHICDGTSGTPDMRDLFVVGGDGVLPTSGNFSGLTGVQFVTTPIAASHVLALGEIPSHAHPFDYSAGGGAVNIGIPGYVGTAFMDSGAGFTRVSFAGSFTGGGSGHTHTLTDATGHTHTNNAPYRALFMIMKL